MRYEIGNFPALRMIGVGIERHHQNSKIILHRLALLWLRTAAEPAC